MDVGHTIRFYREREGMTQRDLAEGARVHVNTISLLERGQVARLDTLAAIAEALGVRVSDLIDD